MIATLTFIFINFIYAFFLLMLFSNFLNSPEQKIQINPIGTNKKQLKKQSEKTIKKNN